MKKLLIITSVICGLSACNGGTSSSSTQDTLSTQGPVENVNGNMPDTTNSLSPSDQGQDSTKRRDTATKNVNKARP